jgi:cell division protein FtsQ
VSSVAAPADRRFRRAHVKPSRKRHDWRRIAMPAARYAAVALVLAFGLYRGAAVAIHAHVLQVDRIIVAGNDRLSRAEVLAALNGLRGQSLVWTDLNVWRRRLLASPWVRDAALRRSLPSTIEVTIAERQPMGIARLNGETYLVDDGGVVIDQYGPQYQDLDLPIVDGLGTAPSESGRMTDPARADLAGRVLAALRAKPAVARRLSQLNVADVHDVSVILTGDPAVIRLGEDQFLPRLQSYMELAPTLRDRVPDIEYVDLRFDNRIYVRPVSRTSRSAANAPLRRAQAKPAAPPHKRK